MKILIFTPLYPQPTRKNLFNDTFAIHYIAKDLVSLNHEVLVIHLYFHSIKEILRTFKFQNSELNCVLPLDGVNIALIERQLYLPKTNHLNTFRGNALRAKIELFIHDIYKNEAPDVIICHFPTFFRGIVDKLRINSPKIAILHDSDIRSIKKEKHNHSNLKKLFENYDSTGYRSLKIMTAYKSYFKVKGLDFVLFSSIDKKLIIDRDDIEKKILNQQKNNTYKILYAGKLTKLKNIDTILHALALTHKSFNYEFSVVGEGNELNKLKHLAKDLGIKEKVKFYGKLNRLETIAIMKSSSIFVMISSPETFGLVYIEAMSQGCITIGTLGEGIDGIIQNEINGFLVEKKNINDLVNVFKRIENMDFKDKLTILLNGINTVTNLSSEIIADKYSRKLEEIVCLCKTQRN